MTIQLLPATSVTAGSGVLGITIDGAGLTIPTGSKGYVSVPFSGTIKSWTLVSDVAGDIEIDVKKCAYAGFPTTASIAAAALPKLVGVQKNTDSTLTGWTVAVAAGDIFEFVVNSATTVTRINMSIEILKG